MNIGCYGFVWIGSFDVDGIWFVVEKMKQVGFDFIEFLLMDLFFFDVVVVKSVFVEYDFVVSVLFGLFEFIDIMSGDLEIVVVGEVFLFCVVDVFVEFGGMYFCGVIYSVMKKYMQLVIVEGFVFSCWMIVWVVDYVVECGVFVLFEVVNCYEINVLNMVCQVFVYFVEVDWLNFGVYFDMYYMNIEELDMFVFVFDVVLVLCYVYIGESYCGYFGIGIVDFDMFFKVFGCIGYDGFIVFELFFLVVVVFDFSCMFGIWCNFWMDNDEFGVYVNVYIREKFVVVDFIWLY